MLLDPVRRNPSRWSPLHAFFVLVMLMVSGHALAGQVTLAWDAVTNATGYKVHYGTSSRGSCSKDCYPNVDATNVQAMVEFTSPTTTTQSGFSLIQTGSKANMILAVCSA